jgi:N-acetylmuramoyl-L-alanine amidase/putative methionine-R-sulfoxide reductase with GAF domain
MRVRPRRVYELAGERPSDTPLQTLLHVVALNLEYRDSDRTTIRTSGHLAEVVSALRQVSAGRFQPQKIFDFAAQRACSLTGATAAAFALAEDRDYVCRARSGESAPALGARFSPHSGLSGECVRTASIVHCLDTTQDSRANADVCRNLQIASMIAVPIFVEGQVRGVLEAFNDRLGAFDDLSIQLLQVLSALVGHALENESSSSVNERPITTADARQTLVAAVNSDVPATAPAPEPTNVVSPTANAKEVQGQANDSPTTAEPISVAPDVVPTTVEHWVEPVSQPWAIGSKSRVGIGLAASALLFAGLWITSAKSHTPAPVTHSSVSASVAEQSVRHVHSALAGPIYISDIDFKSHAEFTAIKIKLGAPVRLRSGSLHSPNRIYFDLLDTQLGPEFAGKKLSVREVNDAFVARIRAVRAEDHSTRIVLDLNCDCDYTAVIPEHQPYELSILVQPPHSAKPNRKAGSAGQPAASSPTGSTLKPTEGAMMPGITIVFDPGHGGADLGTTGPDGLTEKDVALDVARRLGQLLTTKLGAVVVFTRADDRFVSLQDRDLIAKEAHADLLVSIHANSSSIPSTRGVETYYYPGFDRVGSEGGDVSLERVSMDPRQLQAKHLAATVQHELYAALKSTDRGLRNRGVKTAHFSLLMNASMPAILTEVAFISSPSDQRNLSRPETRDAIARGLYRGISGFVTTPNSLGTSATGGGQRSD